MRHTQKLHRYTKTAFCATITTVPGCYYVVVHNWANFHSNKPLSSRVYEAKTPY